MKHLTLIVNTSGIDDPRLPMAQRLFKDMCVEARIRRQVESESKGNDYMPPAPIFKVKRITLSEAVKTAMRFDISRYVMSFAP